MIDNERQEELRKRVLEPRLDRAIQAIRSLADVTDARRSSLIYGLSPGEKAAIWDRIEREVHEAIVQATGE